MSDPRLLALSPSCHQPVNRAVYRELAALGIDVELVVPTRHFVGGKWRETPPFPAEGYGLTHLDLKGTNLRMQTMVDLQPIADRFRPTHIYVDADPASMLVRQAQSLCPTAKIWSITAENLRQSSSAEMLGATRAGNPVALGKAMVKYWLRQRVQRKVDRVFTLSSDGTVEMQRMGLAATQIPLGYDPNLFYPREAAERSAVRQQLGLHAPTIAYFGRQTPEKGIHILIDALARIRDCDWQFLVDDFLGEGSAYAEQLQAQIAHLGLADRVITFESRHEDMPRFMNAADIVVLPSLSTAKWKEQYGRVLQEVMACGRTMVGSRSGAIPEVMDGHGHLFDEGDVEGLAVLLARLLDAAEFSDPRASHFALVERSVNRQAQILADLLRNPAA